MGHTLGFIAFSSFEGISIYFLMMAIFRLEPKKYINRFIPVLSIMILQSFILREEVQMPYVSLVVNVLLFVFFVTTFIKIPLLWSAVVTLSGYVAFGLIQWLLVLVMFGSVDVVLSTLTNGYILQGITGIICLIIATLLLRYRIGFTADFDTLKMPAEKNITIGFIIITMLGMILMAFNVNAMFIVLASFLYFLYFAIKKEREEQ